MYMLRPALIALTLAGLAGAVGARAQTAQAFGGFSADTSAPVEVAADNLSVNQADGSATFTGNVMISQGAMRLKAGQVTVVYAAGGQQRIRSLRAEGGVTLVNGEQAAEAQSANYDVEGGTVTLSGDVVLNQGQNVLSGNELVVNLADGTASVQGRVRSVLQPGSN